MMEAHTSIREMKSDRYLHRTLLTLIIIAVIGFMLFSAIQGFDFGAYPVVTHVHAVAMSLWLILLAVQSKLGSSGNLVLHRRLGWAGVGLVSFIFLSGLLVSFQTLVHGRVPPMFEPGYFLILGLTNISLFAIFVFAAVMMRRNTPWHRRLMLGALLVIFEPVVGRLLPFFVVPAIGGPQNLLPFLEQNRDAFELARMGVHLFIVTVVMLGDRWISGRFHPVYAYVIAGVLIVYSMANGVGDSMAVEAFAIGLIPATQ